MPDEQNGARSDSQPPTVTLPLHCQACGLPVNLTYQPADAYRNCAWACPRCQRLQRIALMGAIVHVLPRD